jgi:hypothetical protein
MRNRKWLAGLALVAGMAGAPALSAAEPYWQNGRDSRNDYRSDYRDLARDYSRIDRLRADIARDRARLDEDIRCGRTREARRDAEDLARDQRMLNAMRREVRYDRGYGNSYYGR